MKTKLTFLSICLLVVAVRADVVSDFEDGKLQGWSKSTELSYFGGELFVTNAGSHRYTLHARDNCSGCGNLLVAAPAQFRGNLSACTGISWDEYIPNANLSVPELHTGIILIGLNGTQFYTPAPPYGPICEWISRYAPFQESAWARATGTNTLAEVLQNVELILLSIEIGINDVSFDEAYVDNVRLIGKTACPTSDLPVIVSQPASRGVCQGSTTTISVVATGAPPLRYQWQFSPGRDPIWGYWSAYPTNLPGATNAQLTLTNVQWANAGIYRVVVFNNCGLVTSGDTALSMGAPTIAEQPTNHVRCAGSSVRFSVRAAGAEPFSYQWQFYGTNLPGRTDSELVLTNVQPADAGGYRVVATEGSPCYASVTSAVATLAIGPPVVVPDPASQQVVEGASATFSALADGTEPLHYQWQFNGTNLPNQTVSQLTLTAVQPTNAGYYRVVVTNACGSVTSAAATLWVLCPAPTIVTQPSSRGAVAGSDVTLWATALGTAPVQYQWQFHGTNLPGKTASELVLSNVRTNDAGPYRVVVLNPCGSVTSAVAVVAIALEVGQLVCYTNSMYPGMNFIAHHVEQGGNTLNEIMPGVPEGTELVKPCTGESAVFLNGAWHDISSPGWPNPITFSPGEAAYLWTTQTFALSFCGAVRQPVLPLNLPATYLACSCQLPIAASYQDITGRPPVQDTLLLRWSPLQTNWVTYVSDGLAWYDIITGDPVSPLVVPIGEAVYIYSPGGSGGGCPQAFPARIVSHPTNQTVSCGQTATFRVVVGCYEEGCPLPPEGNYRWFFNGAPISGATNASLVISNVSPAASGFYNVLVTNTVGSVSVVSRSLPAALQIVDTTAPVVSACATNLTLATDATCHALLPDLRAQVSASDNCGGCSIAQNPPPGTWLDLGTNTVTFTVTDGAGNSNTCMAQVTVVDLTPPTITCAANITTACTSTNGAQVLFTPAALDNCDPAPVITCVPPSGSLFPRGTSVVLCTATDASGNTNTCSFQVTVTDPVAPILRITQQGTNASIFWPQTCTSYSLEENTVLSSSGWFTSTAAVQVAGSEYQATVAAGTGSRFFRLRVASP